MTMSQSPLLNVLGKRSFLTALAGFVLAHVLVFALRNEQEEADFERLREWPNAFCGVLFVILELTSFGCGIAARRTKIGKRGLLLSGLALYPFFSFWSSFGLPFLLLILLLNEALNWQKPDPCPPKAQTERRGNEDEPVCKSQ